MAGGFSFFNPHRRRANDVGEALPALRARPRKRKWVGSMCGLFSPGSALQMLIGATLGVAVGLSVRAAYADAARYTQTYVATWVAFPGMAFIHLMKCFDLPLIALNICVGVQGIAKLQSAGSIGLRTGLLYIFTSVCASLVAIITYAVFKPLLYVLEVRDGGCGLGRRIRFDSRRLYHRSGFALPSLPLAARANH
jgi:hypothetical protein